MSQAKLNVRRPTRKSKRVPPKKPKAVTDSPVLLVSGAAIPAATPPRLPEDFDPSVYLQINPDVAASKIDPAAHYLLWGIFEQRSYRRAHAPDDAAPALHPKTANVVVSDAAPGPSDAPATAKPAAPGSKSESALPRLRGPVREALPTVEGLPEDFEPFLYQRANPDVAASDVDPTWHYLHLGRFENRAYRTDAGPIPDEVDPEFLLDTRRSKLLKPVELGKDGAVWPATLFRPDACDLARITRNRTLLSYLYLRGHGLEVKALNTPMPLRKRSSVTYLEDLETERLIRDNPRYAGLFHVRPHVLDDTDALGRFESDSWDFVVLNNSLHFSQNVIKSLRNAMRVVRPGGVIYASVVDKRYSMDARRITTPLQHFWDDYNHGPELSCRAHYEEFWNNVLVPLGGEQPLSGRGVHFERMMAEKRPIHFHVWTNDSFVGLVQSILAGLNTGCETELVVRSEIETICILRKATEQAVL